MLFSPCRRVRRVLSSGLCHGMTGRQSSIDLVLTAGRRRCADMTFPGNSNSAIQCGYWINWMSWRVIRAVVACTVHPSRGPLAQTVLVWIPSCGAFLLSELETDPGVPTLQAGPGVDRSDERYKAMYFARRLGER